MSDAWAVLLAGVGGFALAYALMQAREQGRIEDKEFQQWRKEIRKMALLITNHTPRQYGGCANDKAAHMAVAKLRQLHTGLAVRISPDDSIGLKLLSSLNRLIADINGGRVGHESHAEEVSLFSALLAERRDVGQTSSGFSFSGILRWVYQLPEYLTEYDRERKTN